MFMFWLPWFTLAPNLHKGGIELSVIRSVCRMGSGGHNYVDSYCNCMPQTHLTLYLASYILYNINKKDIKHYSHSIFTYLHIFCWHIFFLFQIKMVLFYCQTLKFRRNLNKNKRWISRKRFYPSFSFQSQFHSKYKGCM